MKKHKLFGIILLNAAILAGCNPKKDENLFLFDASKMDKQYKLGQTVAVLVQNPENKAIDSIVYFVNDQKIMAKKGASAVNFELQTPKLGYQNLKAKVYHDGEAEALEITGKIEVITDMQPKLLKYTILNTFAHDTLSFTEGLEFYRDTLFEGTGQYGGGKSRLLKTDYKTGKILKSQAMKDEYFGEGITVIGNKIYQMTWREKTGFIYNADTWKLEKSFTYDKDIEGWGMTNDGKYIYQSDGTEKIWRMDPATQKMIDYINVYTGSTKIKEVNELEYINGKIYANVWQKDAIAVVNLETGAVEGIIDFSGLRKNVKNKTAEVLNGIAYNPKTKTVFVTGKYWDKIFEVKIAE